jgi:hypothetical protein
VTVYGSRLAIFLGKLYSITNLPLDLNVACTVVGLFGHFPWSSCFKIKTG